MERNVSGIMLTLLLIGTLTLAFNAEPTKSDEISLLLLTDKDIYTLGENVTITLLNKGNETVHIGGYPAIRIFSYPDEKLVYPETIVYLAWSLEPGENDTIAWNQFNEFNQSYVEPGTYVIRDTQGWELTAYFEIIDTEIIVPDDYSTIQEAINAAKPGDTIFVKAGTYSPFVILDKTVTLIGENMDTTIIDGYYVYELSVVSVRADNARISGFTIKNGWGGICVSSSNGCIITGNRITNNTYRGGGPQIVKAGRGVWIKDSENCTITNNVIYKNDRNISLKGASNNTVINNTITNTLLSWGIVLESSANNSIINNVIKNCNYDGIYLASSSNNNISGNSVIDNGDEGIQISGSNNIIIGNLVKSNSGEGIWLDWSNYNTIIGNTLIDNKKRGLLAWHSGNTTVYHNNFINNAWGQAYSDQMNTWDDNYPSGGNYWSDHNPPDMYGGPYQNETSSDGIGDIPYVIDENNTDRYPLIYPYGFVPTPDVNGDGKVRVDDILTLAKAFGSWPGHPRWDPVCDINLDGKIRIDDILAAALNFGWTKP